ncbi:lipoate--protein ligase family protein [Sporosarcina aquimarina]|uniref:Octanoyl-[GcvH]:protein N-octanoyltransferase n=1 Tax=Sporosarcina aquimarina TaxID=114975 RepID=A0ABU4FV59_9BACL|nr:lipoate--protein ligase family protein [Sporosarcina aquimarina]MDW0108591.1 lipoate--protein ligase family protein [Sporosarcina aquimarina]
MKDIDQYLTIPTWRFLDESLSARTRSALESFAADDTLCQLVGQQVSVPTVRTWVHDNTIVLGIQDHRLPHLEQALPAIHSAGYRTIVRNSGGLAVVLDEGVLNISIVLSEQSGSIDISVGYDVMLAFVRMLFPEVADKIEAYEIVGSYCPGSYDLSIDGKKFAGISQRRLRQGVAVQVYLCVEGSGSARAALVKELYGTGLGGEETKFKYPVIRPETMASLSELLGEPLTTGDVNLRVQQLLNGLAENVQAGGFREDEMELYTYYLNRVVERNAKMIARG